MTSPYCYMIFNMKNAQDMCELSELVKTHGDGKFAPNIEWNMVNHPAVGEIIESLKKELDEEKEKNKLLIELKQSNNRGMPDAAQTSLLDRKPNFADQNHPPQNCGSANSNQNHREETAVHINAKIENAVEPTLHDELKNEDVQSYQDLELEQMISDDEDDDNITKSDLKSKHLLQNETDNAQPAKTPIRSVFKRFWTPAREKEVSEESANIPIKRRISKSTSTPKLRKPQCSDTMQCKADGCGVLLKIRDTDSGTHHKLHSHARLHCPLQFKCPCCDFYRMQKSHIVDHISEKHPEAASKEPINRWSEELAQKWKSMLVKCFPDYKGAAM